jgi:predicted O-methyltransferase YrrM
VGGASAAVIAAAAAIGALAGVIISLARDTQARLMRIERWLRSQEKQLRGQKNSMDNIDFGLHDVTERLAGLRSDLSGSERRLQRSVEGTAQQHASRTQHLADLHFRQLESLLNLHALVDVRGVMPHSRGWAASPDLLLTYVGEILLRRPSLVVECGSGLSTLWAAYALQLCGGGRVVALEHDERFLDKTYAVLAAHDLANLADVRHALIRETKVGAQTHPWYDTDKIVDLYDVGVLLVDGPIGSLAPESRYPAVPLFRERLAPGAAILLDDANRPEEKAIAERWAAEWPELREVRLPHEKGTLLLSAPG